MNKEELYKLSKERLYIIYQDLKNSNIDSNILNSIQFFDEKPSEIFWENYISKNENKVIHFKRDLVISDKYRNYINVENALVDLKWFTEDDKMFFLFYNKKNSILFDSKFFDLIISKTFFLDNEDYLLYCLDTKKIITGGWQGFAVWERLID